MKCPIPPHNKIKIGWTVRLDKAKAIFFPPEPLKMWVQPSSNLSHCPAIQNAMRNTFVIRAPFDIELEMVNGTLNYVNRNSPLSSTFQFEQMNSMIQNEPNEARREPGRHIFQIATPYCFVSDTKNVSLHTLPPFNHYGNWPGIMIAGQFNIYDWPFRKLNWAFEWHDNDRPLIVKRGDPLYYIQFITPHNQRVELVEVADDHIVERMQRELTDVTRFVQNTRKVMELFGLRRPRQLIFPKD